MSDDIVTLEGLALSLVTGGAESKAALRDQANALLNRPSGEGNLTCREVLAAHCSQSCAQDAGRILEQLGNRGNRGKLK